MKKMLILVVVLAMVLPVVVSVAQDEAPAKAVEAVKLSMFTGTVKVTNDKDGVMVKAELVCKDGTTMMIALDDEGKKLAGIAESDKVRVSGAVAKIDDASVITVKKFEVIKAEPVKKAVKKTEPVKKTK